MGKAQVTRQPSQMWRGVVVAADAWTTTLLAQGGGILCLLARLVAVRLVYRR